MPDILLYQGEANPSDIKLRDPTAQEVALSGAASLTFTTAADLNGAAALAAASSLTFSTTAILKGDAAVSGSTALTFTTAGALTGTSALAAASSLTFTNSGDLKGALAMAGVTTIAFAPEGNLSAVAALAGETSLIFTTSGALDVGGAVAPAIETGYPWPLAKSRARVTIVATPGRTDRVTVKARDEKAPKPATVSVVVTGKRDNIIFLARCAPTIVTPNAPDRMGRADYRDDAAEILEMVRYLNAAKILEMVRYLNGR